MDDFIVGDWGAAIGVCQGDVLAGKYRVDGLLGVGATGVVVAAHHLQLDERVALKFLVPAALESPEATARFGQEARAAAKIKSEHVARVRDVGALESGAPYIVMEFLEGSDLSVWLRDKGPLAVEEAVEFVLQACEAVAEAHSFGIIHRDLKPSNLFVVRGNDGLCSVKVLDFGISKMPRDSGDMALTNTQVVMGSPDYMSPEQMRSSADVTPQSDIWSLGIILYELLAGDTPFSSKTFSEICLKAAMERPRPLGGIRPGIPAPLEAVISKCLEKDPTRRFKDVAELASALRDFAPDRAKVTVDRIVSILCGAAGADVGTPFFASPASGCSGDARDPSGTGSTAPCGRTTGGRRGRERSATVIGAAVALLAALGLGFASHGASPRPKTSASRPTFSPAVPPAVHDAVEPTREAPLPAPPSPPSPSPATAQAAERAAPDVAASARRRTPPQQTDCHPPFYFDADDIRVFKKECVH